MRIDDNAEALAMMKRALGSLEAKIREAFNKGYQDGLNKMPDTFVADGVRYYRIKSEPQMTKDWGCSRCKHKDSCIDRDIPNAIHCNNYGKDTQLEKLTGMPEYIRWHDAYNVMDCCSMEVQDDNGNDVD